MRVTTLAGREVPWNFAGCRPKEGGTCSALHARARSLLQNLFPGRTAYEEVPVPGTRMRLDFFLPNIKLAVEVQGSQHTQFNTHHYRGASLSQARDKFRAAQERDRQKALFCECNNIALACLPHDGGDAAWAELIRAALCPGG